MTIVPQEVIQDRIYLIRDKKVMLDSDLAKLYGVETKSLNLAVRRNRDRYPSDFMFQLTKREAENLRFQIETSSWGGSRYLPHAFTEHGILMLSSVLNSNRAVQLNIQIMRTFIKLREFSLTHKDLWIKIEEMEKKFDKQFQVVFKAIKLLLEKPKEDPRKRY